MKRRNSLESGGEGGAGDGSCLRRHKSLDGDGESNLQKNEEKEKDKKDPRLERRIRNKVRGYIFVQEALCKVIVQWFIIIRYYHSFIIVSAIEYVNVPCQTCILDRSSTILLTIFSFLLRDYKSNMYIQYVCVYLLITNIQKLS